MHIFNILNSSLPKFYVLLISLLVAANKVVPNIIQSIVGGNARFACHNGSLQEWRFNSLRLPLNSRFSSPVGFNTSYLVVYGIERNNEGSYSCYGIDENDHIFVSHGVLLVLGEI